MEEEIKVREKQTLTGCKAGRGCSCCSNEKEGSIFDFNKIKCK
jgi:hypothetical protein